MENTTNVGLAVKASALSAAFAERYNLEPLQVANILKDTVLRPSKDDPAASPAEVAAFLIVCNQYELNPFIKEIYGFRSKGKMGYVVSVDGWSTLLNRQPNMNGIEFEEHFKTTETTSTIHAITCRIHRKDRSLPTVVTEYFSECRRGTDTWTQWPIRMLRHKALIQCARLAFGLAGVMDEDEAERMPGYMPPPIIDAEPRVLVSAEAADIMKRLGWPRQRQESSAAAYADREEEFLAFLKAEEAKGKPKTRKAAAPVEQPQEEPLDGQYFSQEPNLDAEEV